MAIARIIELNAGPSGLGLAGRPGCSAPARILVSHTLQDFGWCWPRSDCVGPARCYVYQCAEILELYCETVVPERKAKPLFVAVVNSNDEPLILVPLSIERRHGARILRFLDGGLSDLNAPVVFPATRNWIPLTTRIVWRGMRQISPFDDAIFEKMPDCVGDLANPFSVLKTAKDRTSVHAMTLSRSWDDVLARMPRRQTLRRHRRRLNERGRLAFEVAETAERYDTILDALTRQKTRRYLETRGSDGLARPGYRSFLRSARRLVYPSGPVVIFALMLDGAIIATVLGYIVGTRFYYFMPSFEGEWGAYSPGAILLEDILEWCAKRGFDTFDFGVGDEEYKQGYCDISTALYRAEIPSSVRGHVYLTLRNTRDRIRKMQQRWVQNQIIEARK